MSRQLNPNLIQSFLKWYSDRRGKFYSITTPRGVEIYRNAETHKVIAKIYDNGVRCEVSAHVYQSYIADCKDSVKRKLAV